MTASLIKTGHDFFGQRIFLESTGNVQIDNDLKQLFGDSYSRTRPLEMSRADCKRVLAWAKEKTK